jgi:broad specificity phosphatase PhoE
VTPESTSDLVTIIFETHSTSLDNEAGIASGHNDVDLSEVGLRQAKGLGGDTLTRASPPYSALI